MMASLILGFLAVAGLAVPGAGWIIYAAGMLGWAAAGIAARAPVRNHLRSLRESRGWTQAALADHLVRGHGGKLRSAVAQADVGSSDRWCLPWPVVRSGSGRSTRSRRRRGA
jgi:hypothetical protein